MEHPQKTNMHHGNVLGKEKYGFVSRMSEFLYPGCYAVIVNKTNIRNNNEKHVNRFIFYLLEYCSYLDYIKSYVKAVIQSSLL